MLRDIEEGKAALPRPGGRRWISRLVAVAVVVLVAGTAGWLVARSSGQRLGDETITGDAPSDDVAVLLARARSLLGTDPAGAQALYEQVLDERPEQPEALTYSGWLLFVASNGASADLRTAAISTAQQQLARAVTADASYPDPHCFLAVIAGNADADIPTARAEIAQCLALDPPAEIRGLVEQFAASLDATDDDPGLTVRTRPAPSRLSGSGVSGGSPGGGSAAAEATRPSASGTSSTQIDPLRQSGGVRRVVPRRARAWTRSGIDVAVAAQHGAVPDLAEQLQRRLERGALPEPRLADDRQVEPTPEWRQRLGAAQIGARPQPGDRLVAQPFGEHGRLAPTALVQRPQPVVLVPVPPAARLGVADDEDAHVVIDRADSARVSPVSRTCRSVSARTNRAHTTVAASTTTPWARRSPRRSS